MNPVTLLEGGRLSSFDPDLGATVMAPESDGDGYWVGCPGVVYEPARDRFLLTYRQRRPRGTDRERGWRIAIAESGDGVRFRDVWAAEKEELGTCSLERSCLLAAPEGGYRLYISYVDPADNRWRIDVLRAETPDAFSVAGAEPVLTAASTQTEGVKDPYALYVGPALYLFASYAEPAQLTDGDRAKAHASGDIYNTGVTVHPTGLATSLDGESFDWRGQILGVGGHWDRYQARLNSVIRVDNAFLGFYDGSGSAAENYEERTGLALSFDLVNWQRLTVREPWVVSPYASGSVRYVDVVSVDGEWWLYYEMTRADGAHELRLSRVGVE